MDFKHKNHIIFDMDGLLIDTESIYLEGWKDAFRQLNTGIPEREAYEMIGLSIEQNSNRIYSYVKSWDKVKNIRKHRYDYFHRQFELGNLHLMPHAEELLKHLTHNGYSLSLCTSTFAERAEVLLDHFNLKHYFSSVLFGDSVSQTKPDPEIYLKTLSDTNHSPNDSLVLEDSLTGISAANSANIETIWVYNENLSNTEFNKNNIKLKFENIVDVQSSLKNIFTYF